MFSILKDELSFMIHLKMENLYLSTAKILVKTLNSFSLWILYILGLQTHTFGLGVCFVQLTSSPPGSVQLLSCVQLFLTPWTAARQASLSITNSWSLPKLIELVMPSNHFILCCHLLLPPSIFPNIRVFSNESALHIK